MIAVIVSRLSCPQRRFSNHLNALQGSHAAATTGMLRSAAVGAAKALTTGCRRTIGHYTARWTLRDVFCR